MADNELPANEYDDRRAGAATTSEPLTQQSTGTAVVKSEDPAASGGGAGVKRPGDRVFEFFSTISAALITVLVAAIGIFLLIQATPPLMRNDGGLIGFFTYGGQWQTSNLETMQFGIPNLFFVTMMVSIIALIIAMPIALGIAIFLSLSLIHI